MIQLDIRATTQAEPCDWCGQVILPGRPIYQTSTDGCCSPRCCAAIYAAEQERIRNETTNRLERAKS